MKQIIELKERIREFRHLLDLLKYDKENKIEVVYNPVNNFSNKEEYPVDFGLFMEEIGELEVSYSGEGILLRVEKPIDLIGNEDGEDSFLNIEWNEIRKIFNKYDENNIVLSKDVKIISRDFEGYLYGFSKKRNEKTYNFIFEEKFGNLYQLNFFDWLQKYMFTILDDFGVGNYTNLSN